MDEVVDRVENLQPWSVIVGPDERLLGAGAVSGGQAVAVVTSDHGESVILGRSDGTASIVHDPGPGWVVQQTMLVDGIAVDAVANDDEQRSAIYRLTEGAAPVPIGSWDRPLGHIPEMAATGSTLVYTDRIADGSTCVTAYDMVTESTENLICGTPDSGNDIGWLAASEDTGSYIEWRQGSDCGHLIRFDFDTTEPVEVATGEECVFQGVSLSAFSAWMPPPTPDSDDYVNYFDVPVYGSDGAKSYSLGRGAAGSISYCDDHVNWLTIGPEGEPAELRRWRPGAPVEVIYRSPDGGPTERYATSQPSCSEPDQVTFQRAGFAAGAPDELLAMGEHDWSFELGAEAEPAEPDPEAFLQALSADPRLSEWAASRNSEEVLDDAVAYCETLDSLPEAERVPFIYAQDQELKWMTRVGTDDSTAFYAWRQVATMTMCAAHYPLTLGD